MLAVAIFVAQHMLETVPTSWAVVLIELVPEREVSGTFASGFGLGLWRRPAGENTLLAVG